MVWSSRWHVKGRLAAGVGTALVLMYCPPGAHRVYAAPPGPVQKAPPPATPNRFDPTSRATSVKPGPVPASPTTSASSRATAEHHPLRTAGAGARPATLVLDPSKPGHLSSSDSALDVDVPAGAVSAADVAAHGGSMSLMVRRVLPASGGSAGGSGHVTFGTFLVQVLDATGGQARQGLRRPLSFDLHFGGREGAL